MRPRRIKNLSGRRVFITGAASGIGRATALACAQEGAQTLLTDLHQEPLDTVVDEIRAAGGSVLWARAGDVSDHDTVRALAQEITRDHGAMDVVMNIAGISSWGTIASIPHETWERLVQVNLMGPIHVMEYLIPPMIDAKRGGHVVNVSSAAGIIGMPWHAGYSATKFGLRGVSEVLRFDLRRHGIGVSLVCPGGVDTGLTRTIEIAGVDKNSTRYKKALNGFRGHAITPEKAAEAILRGVKRRRFWVYTSIDIRLVHLLQRYFEPGYVLAMRVFNTVANRVLPEVSKARRQDALP